MGYGPRTENEMLRERCKFYEDQLRKIDLETAHAAIERRAELAKEADRKAVAEQTAREAEALEQHRIGAWVNHRIESVYDTPDPNQAFLALLSRDLKSDIPADLWPPGRSADEYKTIALPPPPPDPEVAGTRLGQMFAAKGIAL